MVASTSTRGHLSWSKERRTPREIKFSSAMNDVDEKVKRFHGDGLSLRLDSNDRVLEITGDGCRITLAKNCGSVRVVGDGCSVKIVQNEGDIVYKGDGGRVLLGPDSSKENVKYVGDGGSISFDRDLRRTLSKHRQNSGPDVIDILRNSKVDPSTERMGRMDEEETENLRNERKEARQSIRKGRRSERDAGKSKETSFVRTKIVATTENNNVVKRWFVSPTSVMRSFDEDEECVNIVSNKITKREKVNATEENGGRDDN